MAGINTVLNYSIVPNPVHVGGNPQDIVIIATLKSTAEFGQPLSSATIKSIVIDFGPATGNDNSLIVSGSPIKASDANVNNNWTVSDAKDSNGNTLPNSVELTPPSDTWQIMDDAIVLTVQGVQVNNHRGNVTITITETVSKINGSAKLPPPLTATNQTSLTLAKVEEKTTGGNTFTSNHYVIKSGGDVTLSWNIADNTAPVSLHYISNNKFVHTGKPTAGNPYPGITSHADGTSLQSKDHYPNQKYNDSPTALTLTDTTVFILKVGSDTYLTCTVIVENANITAKSITADSLTIGNWTIEISPTDNNLCFKNSGGANLTVTPQGQVSINHGLTVYEGITSATGGLGVSTGGITATGDVNITGNLWASETFGAGSKSTFYSDIIVNGGSYVKQRGGKTYVGSLQPSNGYQINELFTNPGGHGFTYNYYEFVINSIKPKKDNSQAFGLRFFYKNNGIPNSSSTYMSVLYGNDSKKNRAESFTNTDYLRLWASDRNGPTSERGILGTMTLYRQDTIGVIAHLFAPDTVSKNGCQIWVEGTQYKMEDYGVTGVEVDFYDNQGIASGYVDIYGWN